MCVCLNLHYANLNLYYDFNYNYIVRIVTLLRLLLLRSHRDTNTMMIVIGNIDAIPAIVYLNRIHLITDQMSNSWNMEDGAKPLAIRHGKLVAKFRPIRWYLEKAN